MKFRSGKSVAQWSTSDDVERVLVQRPDRRALVHVDVLDAEFLCLLQVAVGGRVAELVTARAVVPLGGVELHALRAVPLDVAGQLHQADVAVARVEAGVRDEHPRVLLPQGRVALGGVEPLRVPLLEVGRLEDRDVHVAVLEDVLHQVVLGVGHELLDRPVRLLRAEALVGVEALDPALGVLLRALDPVGRGRVPVVHVRIDDEVLLAVLLVQGSTPPNSSSRARLRAAPLARARGSRSLSCLIRRPLPAPRGGTTPGARAG